MRPFRTLDSLRQSLAISLGFGAVSSMVSLQQPILTEFLQQAQNQLWRDVRWRHLLRVHQEWLGQNQRVLDLPDDYQASETDRVFITTDFEKRCTDCITQKWETKGNAEYPKECPQGTPQGVLLIPAKGEQDFFIHPAFIGWTTECLPRFIIPSQIKETGNWEDDSILIGFPDNRIDISGKPIGEFVRFPTFNPKMEDIPRDFVFMYWVSENTSMTADEFASQTEHKAVFLRIGKEHGDYGSNDIIVKKIPYPQIERTLIKEVHRTCEHIALPCARWQELTLGLPRLLNECFGLPRFYEINSRYDVDNVQIEFYPIMPVVLDVDAKKGVMVSVEYYAKPDRFNEDNDRASVPDDILLTLAIIMGKGHYRQPDVQLYADRFERMLRDAKASNFASDGEQASSKRILSDPYLKPVRGI